jgi:3-ketosteroid 9alpha-monooxygenase subunit B
MTLSETRAADAEGFYPIRVAAVEREANEAVSIILDLPAALEPHFAYRAGQYVTLRVTLDGKALRRCYSMSTAPETDRTMRITVKRVEDGRVSRWVNDQLEPGDIVDVMPPAGIFCLRRDEGLLLLFAGGSGITPILSLAKAALASTARPVTLVYANRDRASAIFAGELDALASAHGDRLRLIHWHDAESGLIDKAAVRALGVLVPDADLYICGPAGFMTVVEAAALASGADLDHIFTERFVSPPDEDHLAVPTGDAVTMSQVCESLVITLRGKAHVIPYEAGDTIVEAARRAGVHPPVSCQMGACATCMAKVLAGSVAMFCNDALTPAEVGQGYILTCQGLPTSREVSVLFED